MIFATAFLAVVTIIFPLVALAGPVNVRIEANDHQSFHIGPEPRTRFELVEQYSPLASARVATGPAAARAFASKTYRQPQPRQKPVQLTVDFGESGREQFHPTREHELVRVVQEGDNKNNKNIVADKPQQPQQQQQQPFETKVITHSIWLDWTRWSACANGERHRVRQCFKINGAPCIDGPNQETQKCFSTNPSGIKFKDPMTVEREIRRDPTPLIAMFVEKEGDGHQQQQQTRPSSYRRGQAIH